MSHTAGNGNDQHVDFRALHTVGSTSNPDYVYFSWVVKFDPLVEEDVDALWFGIEQLGGNPPIVVRLRINTTDEEDAQEHPEYSVSVYEADPTTGDLGMSPIARSDGNPEAPPGWLLQSTRLWIMSGNSWAFQTVIPIDAAGLDQANVSTSSGLNIGTNFRMWYALYMGIGPVDDPVQYPWPFSAGPINPDGIGGVPAPSTWKEFWLGSPPEPSSCLGGITIASPLDIGTTNNPNSAIQFFLPPSGRPTPLPLNYAPTPSNTFFVKPTNRGSSPIPAESLSATFWIANWGSQPVGGDITSLSDLWTKIEPSNTPTNIGDIAANSTASDTERNEATWDMSVCEWYNLLNPYNGIDPVNYPDSDLPVQCDAATERFWAGKHQCILVELTSAHEYTFLRKSWWRNMDFVQASEFSRDAEITVKALRPSEGAEPKTVYLYVQTQNMPKLVTRPHRDSPQKLYREPRDSLRDTGATVRQQETTHPGEGAAQDFFVDMQVDSLLPAYRIHAYRATADSVLVRGRRVPVLRPQSSFGYYVLHDGEVAGWRHSLDAEAELERVGPNLYRITVPNDGFVIVTTQIEAVEPKLFAASLHAGVAIPHGTLRDSLDPGPSITVDFAYRVSRRLDLEALLGYHRFEAISIAAAGTSDLAIYNGSAGLRFYPNAGRARAYLGAGGGAYIFDPGSTEVGVHSVAGLQYNLSLNLALEAQYTVHTVFTSGSNSTFSSIQVGGRLRF